MNNIKKFRQENLLSTEEIVVQFWSCSADCDELFEEWKKTPFDPNREEWNGIEMQVGMYLEAIIPEDETLKSLSEEDLDELCTFLTNEIYDYHEAEIAKLDL